MKHKSIHLTNIDIQNIVTEVINKLKKGVLIKESYYDLNEIGSIEFTCNFDEEYYNEWLEDNNLTHSTKTLETFYKEEVSYELELTDSEYYHHMDYQTLSYDDIVDDYSEKIANAILSDCIKKGRGSLEILEYMCDDIDINNPNELNSEAMKLLKYGNYFKDARGYILSNGVVIYTEQEHNMVSRINGIKNTFHFIQLGNIRVLPNSIDMARKPTPQQERILLNLVKCYSNDVLYVDFMTPNGNISKTYNNPNFELLLRDIHKIYG